MLDLIPSSGCSVATLCVCVCVCACVGLLSLISGLFKTPHVANHLDLLKYLCSGITGAADIRLVGGTDPNSGRLEVKINGVWGTVCNRGSSFAKTEADLACRQLGAGQAFDYGNYTSYV